MSKIIKVIDEEMDHPLDYRITDSGRGNDIKRFVPEPGTNNLDNATPVDRELLEQIQKNGVYEVETVHTVNSSSIDIYNCEIEGLDDFGIYKNIFIKMLVDMPNEFDQPKIKLNDIEYTLLYKPENEDFKPLDAGMLKAGQFYNLVFNGSQFVVENGSLPATPDSSGIISQNEIKELIRLSELLTILGLEYGGYFGSELTQIEADKVYFYKDGTTGKFTPYVALATKTGTFITPDVNNFQSLTIRDNLFYQKLYVAVPSTTHINISMAFLWGNMLFVNGFITNSTTLNNIPAGQIIINLAGMIPTLSSYSIYATTVTGSNLDIRDDFSLTKATGLTFQDGEHFTITAGLRKGTIF